MYAQVEAIPVNWVLLRVSFAPVVFILALVVAPVWNVLVDGFRGAIQAHATIVIQEDTVKMLRLYA